MDLSHLNPSQREAVLCTDGPLLVLAGAGSGKTRVITTRIAYLVEQGIPPESIVALSFTNKAAQEMRERLEKMIGKAAHRLAMGTFHSLGVRMMREDPDGFHMPQRFSILDQGDVYGVVRSLLREHGFHGTVGDRRYDLGAVVQRISLWKNEFLTGDQCKERAKGAQAGEYDEVAAAIFDAYDDRLRQMGGCDFDDLVCRIAWRLSDDAALRKRWTDKFQYIMVDEYQDTNTAQFEMLRQLLGPANNLCVVGDDDQAIYGWRGAKVANILGLDMYFRDAKVVRLQENYRSRPPILEAANSCVQHNKVRHDKQLLPTKRGGDPVYEVCCPDQEQENKWVGRKIRDLIFDDRVPASEIAVLYRSARQAKPIEEYLQADGIPYRVLGGQSFQDKKEVKDAMAYLKLIVAPYDELALRRAMDTPPRGIGRRSVDALARFARDNNCRLIDAVHRVEEVEGITTKPRSAIANFSRQIRAAAAQTREQRSTLVPLRDFLFEVRLRDNVLKETGSGEATKIRWEGVEWLFRSIERFESKSKEQGRGSWGEFLGNLLLDKSKDQDLNEAEAPRQRIKGEVTLATMHSSKGLEWDKVLIIGCEEGTMPHKRVMAERASDAISGDLEEERRLFYVGITRARETLWITRAEARVDRGREMPTIRSRFLEELPPSVRQYDITKEERLSADKMDEMANAFLAKFAAPSDS
jgi:DNA helicase-2/ATP-dependent DNA helicase PcrA